MPDDTPLSKHKASLIALKGANAHLNEIFTQLSRLDQTAGNTVNELRRLSNEVGSLSVKDWDGNNWVSRSFKAVLENLAANLDKVRT